MANAAQWFGLLLLFAGVAQLLLDSVSGTQTKDTANGASRWEPCGHGAR
jgi:hypothetical protein